MNPLPAFKRLATRHPVLVGLGAAAGFTLLFNQNLSGPGLANLIFALPCLLMMLFCLKGMDSKRCSGTAKEDLAVVPVSNQPTDKR